MARSRKSESAPGPGEGEPEIEIRYHVRQDFYDTPGILTIENASFPAPWSAESFLQLVTPGGPDDARIICKVATCGGAVVGYVVYQIDAGQFNLLSVAVAPELRRRGIGRRLVAHLCEMCRPVRRPLVRAMARDDDLDAHLFLRKLGFRCVQVKRRHFDGDDGYLFEWARPPRPAARAREETNP